MARRILIIDDDPMIRHIVKSILSAEGHDIVEAEHGEAAAALIDAEPRPVAFSCIICDVNMPGLSGFELLSRFKSDQDTQHIPFVMLTAENKSEDIMTGYSVGADYYIPKPFTSQQLLFGLQLVLADTQQSA